MSLLNKIRKIGLRPTLSDEESSVVMMVNDALILCILFTSFDCISSIILGNWSVASFTFLFSSLFVLSLVLHHFEKYYFSRVLLILLLGVLFVTQAYLFGNTVDITNLYIVLIVFVIVVFEKERRTILFFVGYVLAVFFLKNWIIDNLDHPLENKAMPYAKEIYFILALLLVSVLILRVLNKKESYIKLSNSLLNDLEKNNSALKESNDRLKSFAYATSHDLKTPLRNVASYIELLTKRLSGSEDKKLADYLQMTRKGVGLMNESIDDILTLSSLDYNSELWTEIVLDEIIEELKFNYQDSLEKGNLEIHSNALPTIKGNKTQLFVLFQNLIDNGIKYNDSQKVKITIKGESTSDGVTITFKDNGIGIESQYADYIFEPFKRLHSNSRYQGTGLGLAIVKKIIDSHSATIELGQQETDTGALFKMHFPN